MTRSRSNNRTFPLEAGGTFTGTAESTALGVAISVSILVPTSCTLTIQQSYDKNTWFIAEQYPIPANIHKTIQQAVGLEFFRVILHNDGITQTFCHLISTLTTSLTQNVNIRNLEASRDTVTVSNLAAEQVVAGENSNFVFYPTAANNTVSVYADGTQGTTVTGGWQYNNINNSGKINWYCYASPSAATAYKVSQLNSMYTVVNNLSTLGLAQAQNPWIMIYTQMDSGTNSGAFYKSRLFFGSNAHTDILGIKLLYTGEDPVDIHPEITGINRIQLNFNSALSDNKLLANVQNELILAGSLQTTNNTTPANSFAFVMQEFGADWVKTPAVLPIENGAVVTSLTPSLNTVTINQAVSAVSFAGTAFDMAENSLVDVLLLGTGITNGNVRLDYSADGATWFPDNLNTYPITTTDPHYVIRGLKTASRYIRISTGLSSLFRATNLLMVFSSKRD